MKFATKEQAEEHLHYLKVLKKNCAIMQPEVRKAISFAITAVAKVVEIMKSKEMRYALIYLGDHDLKGE